MRRTNNFVRFLFTSLEDFNKVHINPFPASDVYVRPQGDHNRATQDVYIRHNGKQSVKYMLKWTLQ